MCDVSEEHNCGADKQRKGGCIYRPIEQEVSFLIIFGWLVTGVLLG